MMTSEIYGALAERLDSIPNGFARTESGVELRLLEKLFEPEEARIAAVMELNPESPAEIGTRAGLAPDEAEKVLFRMSSKGLIRAQGTDSGPVFGLMPFIVGIYEGQLGRMDREMAELFERYIQETRGGSTADGGMSVHRVIPVERSIPVELEIFPYEQASRLLDGARSWGVRRCICRVQKGLIGEGCEHTLENCLVFAPTEGAFEKSDETRTITREEAQRILGEAAEEGLIHSTMNQQDQIFYICNCCTCCCGVMRGVAEFGIPTAVARSAFRAAVASETCSGCGACVDRCQFGALSVSDGISRVDRARCVGCGVCVTACPVEALTIERRPEEEVEEPPRNFRHWMSLRSRERGLSTE